LIKQTLLIAVNGDQDGTGSVGMRLNVMRPADVVERPAPRFQICTFASQKSDSSLGRPNCLVFHSFVLGRQPTHSRFNGVGLGLLDRIALSRAAQRRNHDGEAAVRLGQGDRLV